MKSKEVRGLAKLSKGMASCAAQATTYGQCIASKYKDVHKDMCVKEFEAFKSCVQHALKRSW
ncbi:uncharacterized protein BYT42DRAFT_618201 [Radiomyces spectabilis]|uniref:uncharacterized protein n=1 Tax=Radiomyces spectabilis TaxID=64574 RepID=UPI00221F9B65|nr:uncharacterized protein BYT42DRAFT_618201 [Radiomyces spectabilis]KAI8366695.1 hypothetical protein BYT42DRAFT_618201 [Radiomyces spectabilis]